MLEILAAGIMVLCILLILYLLFGSKPVKYQKKVYGGNTSLVITAKCNLAKVLVTAKFDQEEIAFERKRIRKGQTIEFVYPSSKNPAKLIVQTESGRTLAFEV